MAGEADAFLLFILAFLIPPVAVAFLTGCGADLCLNILLTILGWLPGCIHAFWLILRRAEANERYGHGNWTYAGMGEYFPRNQALHGAQPGAGQPPPSTAPAPAPAMTQYTADNQPPSSQVPAPSSGYPGPPPEPPAGQQGTYVPPPPADKK